MEGLLGLAGCVGEASIIYILAILMRLSRKLGEVKKERPYFRAYFVAIGLVSAALAMRIVGVSAIVSTPTSTPLGFTLSDTYSLVHHALLAVGLTIALLATLRYWGWLLREPS
jgi:hypothetical protein